MSPTAALLNCCTECYAVIPVLLYRYAAVTECYHRSLYCGTAVYADLICATLLPAVIIGMIILHDIKHIPAWNHTYVTFGAKAHVQEATNNQYFAIL